MTVYIIRNQITGKIYIGQTRKSIYQRWRGHVKASKSKTLACSRMWIARAIAKYGAENFTIEPLGVYEDLKSMNRAEMDFIAQYRSTDPDIGYNIALGGDGHTMGPEERRKVSERNKRLFQGGNNPFFGKTHSDEFKARMSAIQSGRKDSPDVIARRLETLRKSGKAIGPLHHHYGQSPSEETKKKLSAAFSGEKNPMFGKSGTLSPAYGRKCSEEAKEAMRAARKGVPRMPEHLAGLRAAMANPEKRAAAIAKAKETYRNNPARQNADSERMRRLNEKWAEQGVRHALKHIPNLEDAARRVNAGESIKRVADAISRHPTTLKRRLFESGLCPQLVMTPEQMKGVKVKTA